MKYLKYGGVVVLLIVEALLLIQLGVSLEKENQHSIPILPVEPSGFNAASSISDTADKIGLYTLADTKLHDLQETDYWEHGMSTDSMEIEQMEKEGKAKRIVNADGVKRGEDKLILYTETGPFETTVAQWGFNKMVAKYDRDQGIIQHGEILYEGSCDISLATDLWKTSPKHAKIMHDQSYNEMMMVMGRKKSDPNTCYIVGEYRK